MKPDPAKVKNACTTKQSSFAVHDQFSCVSLTKINIATIMRPLRTKTNVHFEWGSPADNALSQIKDISVYRACFALL